MAKGCELAKAYRNLGTIASFEATRLSMLKKKVESEERLMLAMARYYDEQADIQFENDMFGFDLDLR